MSLQGKKVLITVADLVDEREFLYPYYRLQEEGVEVTIAGLKNEPVTGAKGMYPMPVDCAIEDVSADDFDGIIIPGGFAPDRLRESEAMLQLVRDFDAAEGKTLAFICHAGWVPEDAGVLKGRKITSLYRIRNDVIGAGAEWVDEEVVVDGDMVSSRNPRDLAPFMKGVLATLSK